MSEFFDNRGTALSTNDQSRSSLAQSLEPFASSKMLATMAVCASLFAHSEAAQAKKIAPPKGGPAGQVGMSDERTITRWAHGDGQSFVRSWPSTHSKARFPLRATSPDGTPEVYIVRSIWNSPKDHEWARIRIPARRHPIEGWVSRTALSAFGVSHNAIRINRKLERLTLYENGKPILRTPVGVGKAETPTPAGHFWVRDRYRVNGSKTFQFDGMTYSNSVFGPKVIMTTANSQVGDGGVIGIHGTNQPWLIPGRPSHGCVRVLNDKIGEIYPQATPGTPVEIL